MYKLSALTDRVGRAGLNAGLTLGFYALLVGVAFWLENVSPSGPCTPGGIILVLFGLPVIGSVLLIINGLLVVNGRRQHWASLVVHGLALGSWWLVMHRL